MIFVTPQIAIQENELHFDAVQASGPGGQNVNKVATAIQLRYDIAHSPALPADVRQRLQKLAGKRINSEGVLVIEAKQYRTQEQNRQEAITRLIALVHKAAQRPNIRHQTRPSFASRQRRMENKRRRSEIKRLRQNLAD